MNSISKIAAWAGLATFVALLQTPAFADSGDGESVEGTRLESGVAMISEVRPYRGFNNKIWVMPVPMLENRWVRLSGPSLEVKLWKTSPVSFGLLANYAARDGYETNDSPMLVGMAERKSSFWLGGRASLRSDIANVTVEWVGDASNNSKGQKFKLGVERRFDIGDVGVTPRLSTIWHDCNFIQYYFGVDANEARSDRTAYYPGATVSTEVGLRLDYRLAPKHTAFVDFGVMSLGSAIKSSPLVDRTTSVPEARIGYLYRF